jgi:predicted metalloenzyme YecM
MTQDIFAHLENTLSELQELKNELELNINDPELDEFIMDELDSKVVNHLHQSIESLADILNTAQKIDDAAEFYNPDDWDVE